MELIDTSCNNCGSLNGREIAQGPDFEYRCTEDEFTMMQCNACGLVFLNPRPASSELSTIYPEHYIPYRFDQYLSPAMSRVRMFMQKSKVKAVKRLASPGAVIWDVGCGGGFLLQCLKQYGLPSWHLLGIDISEPALEKVRVRGIDTHCSRFESMDPEPESVDVIILNQVIEHLDNPAAVVAKAQFALKVGGYLFIETPSLDGWDAMWFRSRHWGGWHFPRHWTLYTRATLGQLLNRSGFSIVDMRWLLSPNFWVQSVHHWLVDHGASEAIARFVDCRNVFLMCCFSGVDVLQSLFGHTSNMRVVARKK